MNEKVKDFFRQNIGYFIVALVSIVYIATAFITIDETGKTIGQIIADSLINRTFPTYKEGKGTQANELSTRWAHRVDIQAGDKTAVSFNGSWYLIEKFDDSEWGYQIIDKITEQEYLLCL